MRIALLAPLRHPIKPPFMGGLEAHCWHLARGLKARGHQVTLFASGDSDVGVPVFPVLRRHARADFPDPARQGDAHLRRAEGEEHGRAAYVRSRGRR